MAAVIVGKKHKKILWLLLPFVVLFFLAVVFLLSKGLVLGGDSIRLVETRPAGDVDLRSNLTFLSGLAEEEVGKPSNAWEFTQSPMIRWFRKELLPGKSPSGLPLPTVRRLTRPLANGRLPAAKDDFPASNGYDDQLKTPNAATKVYGGIHGFQPPIARNSKHLQYGSRRIGYHLKTKDRPASFFQAL